MTNGVEMHVEHGLRLLFTQLTWPSGLVRERACVQIAKLLLDPEYSGETRARLIAWMKSQNLESVNALGLLPFLLRDSIKVTTRFLPSKKWPPL